MLVRHIGEQASLEAKHRAVRIREIAPDRFPKYGLVGLRDLAREPVGVAGLGEVMIDADLEATMPTGKRSTLKCSGTRGRNQPST